MLILFRKEELLYVKCKLNLKRAIRYLEKVFEVGVHEELLLPEEVMHILTENGNIRLWNGKKFIKLNLGQFNDVMVGKLFKVELFVEPKKEEVKPQPVVKQEPPVIPEVVEEEKIEESKDANENKKKRHKQNQGGDK